MGGVEGVKTPLLVQLESFGRVLSIFSIILALVTFAVAMTRPEENGYSFAEAFRIAVTVAVAIIPEVRAATVCTIVLCARVCVRFPKATLSTTAKAEHCH